MGASGGMKDGDEGRGHKCNTNTTAPAYQHVGTAASPRGKSVASWHGSVVSHTLTLRKHFVCKLPNERKVAYAKLVHATNVRAVRTRVSTPGLRKTHRHPWKRTPPLAERRISHMSASTPHPRGRLYSGKPRPDFEADEPRLRSLRRGSGKRAFNR